MTYIDFYDVAGTYAIVSDIVKPLAPNALVREDGFQRRGYGTVHRVYLTDHQERAALNTVTRDVFPQH
jgi:hypothetical protein